MRSPLFSSTAFSWTMSAGAFEVFSSSIHRTHRLSWRSAVVTLRKVKVTGGKIKLEPFAVTVVSW
jgi:hypothetical protein